VEADGEGDVAAGEAVFGMYVPFVSLARTTR
jgi:hypothetical protein